MDEVLAVAFVDDEPESAGRTAGTRSETAVPPIVNPSV